MARRRQFIQLIYDLRAELDRSSDPAAGVSDLPTLKRKLERIYETLYADYDWPHLNELFTPITLNAGQRYYDFPETLDFDRLEDVAVWWNGQPLRPTRGIGFEELAQYNSDDDARSDPVQKWDVRLVTTVEQIEVWPIPASSGQTLQFKGIRKFVPLVNDADLCLIDDHVVILHAAAELVSPKSGNKQMLLAAAQQRMARVKGRSKTGTGSIRIGMGASPKSASGVVIRVSG